jgi:hypothetical protein
MSDKLKGICIGGSADGQVWESHGPVLHVAKRKPIPEAIPTIETLERDDYLWTPLGFPEGQFGFWRLATISPRNAVMRVFEAYGNTI